MSRGSIQETGDRTQNQDASTLPALRCGQELVASVEHVRVLHGEIMEHMRSFAEKVVLCGFELLALKRQVGHGRWVKFCDEILCQGGLKLRHVQNYMQVATAVRTKMRLLHGGEGMEELDRGVVDLEAVREALADSTDATSWRQLWMDLGLIRNPKPRGGDHGGGEARAKKLQEQADFLDESLAKEQWVRIVQDLRNFVDASRFAHIHPAELSAGIQSIRDCLAKIPREG